MIDDLLRQVSRTVRQEKDLNNSGKPERVSKVSAAFKQIDKIPEPLKLAMNFEKHMIVTCIDKIA